jgi:hypothetical protein
VKICSKKYFNEPKSFKTEISEVFMAYAHTKKVKIVSFIRPSNHCSEGSFNENVIKMKHEPDPSNKIKKDNKIS